MTGRVALVAVLVLVAVALTQPLQAEPPAPERQPVRLTFYRWTGSPMSSGHWPYEGAAACSYDYELGTWLVIDDRVLRCLDRGHLHEPWVDVFCATAECEAWVRARPGAVATRVSE